jgi:hypothetical protein
MKIHQGSFKKKDGSVRVMKFIPISEIPNDLKSTVTKGGQASPLGDGHERVWDIETHAWRTFNHLTIVDSPVEVGETDTL